MTKARGVHNAAELASRHARAASEGLVLGGFRERNDFSAREEIHKPAASVGDGGKR